MEEEVEGDRETKSDYTEADSGIVPIKEEVKSENISK